MFRSLKYSLWLFLPLGAIHLLIIYARNKFYDWQILKTKRLFKPVISIGNLQMGGTGKTPLTIAILKKLQKEGVSIGILSRGYKRKSDEEIIILKAGAAQDKNFHANVGDEPAIIFEALANGTMGIGADRFRVGEKMLEQHPVDMFLLDDGLQHRQLHREVDICLIDVTRWKSHPFLFPFSYLRDCKSSLKRCQAVILTKVGDQREKAQKIRQGIKSKYNIPVFEGDLQPRALINIKDGSETEISNLNGQRAIAFCGIAHPAHFLTMLKQIGVELVFGKKFPDHHTYTLDDLTNFENIMKEKGIKIAITTEKDAVKLKSLIEENGLTGLEFFYLKIKFVLNGEKEIFQLIQNLLPPKSFK